MSPRELGPDRRRLEGACVPRRAVGWPPTVAKERNGSASATASLSVPPTLHLTTSRKGAGVSLPRFIDLYNPSASAFRFAPRSAAPRTFRSSRDDVLSFTFALMTVGPPGTRSFTWRNAI